MTAADLRVNSSAQAGPLGSGDGSHPKDDNPPPATPYGANAMLHSWLLERLQEGDRINRSDPAYSRSGPLISDVMGDQPTSLSGVSGDSRRVVLNQIRKAINTHASVLTDVKPLWEYRTLNTNYTRTAKVYNDLLTSWWLRTNSDMELADGARYSATIGSSDIIFEYDQKFCGGDMRLHARDWRDTIPIRPERTASIQDWEGVIFCEQHSAAKVRATFPGRRVTVEGGTGVGVGTFTRWRKLTRPEAQVSTLSGLGASDPNSKQYAAQASQATVLLYRAFYRDKSINLTNKTVLMGPPGANWSYYVEPGKPLYPRGRCSVFDAQGILWDGPNPYWHAKWPGARLSLQRWPWLMIGMPLAFDLRQLAHMLNITVNDFLQVFSQWVHRGTIWGKNAPDSLMNRFDPTKPNWKVKVNNVVGTGFQLSEGPQLPPWAFQFLTFLFQKWDELSGVANLTQLLTLRQSPSAETLEKYMEAMTPELRLEARQIELFLREISDMFIFNATQFYSRARRQMILGEAGLVLEDSDYDPDTLIPAMDPVLSGKSYIPELDRSKPRDERARFFMGCFSFYVAPHSLLSVHAQERKMLYLQLSRQGYMDFWTLGEMNEIANLGEPPVVLLPKNLTEDEIRALPMTVDPATGQQQPQIPMELRRPVTVTERLMAQQQMGIGQTASPAGRKASGQQPPKLEQKSDGSTTVSESG